MKNVKVDFSTIAEMFYTVADKHKGTSQVALKHKPAGSEAFISLTHDELRNLVECFALGLMELGIRRNDRIGIVSENRLEWMIADLGCITLGAIDVPIFPTHTSKQEEYIFSNSAVTAIIVSNNFQLSKVMEFKENLPALRHVIVMNDEYDHQDVSVKSMKEIIDRGKSLKNIEERRKILKKQYSKITENDVLTIIYTSGTTGDPKGVVLTHKNVVSNIDGFIQVIHFNTSDTFLSFLPLCHSYERTSAYYGGMSQGSTIAIAEAVETVASNIIEIKPTILTTVPKLLETIRKKILISIEKESAAKKKVFNWALDTGKKYLEAKNKGKNPLFLRTQFSLADKLVFSKIKEKTGGKLRYFISGGAALAPEVAEFFLAMDIIVLEGYGLTESSPVIAVNQPDNIEIGTVGMPLPNIEVKIAEDGEILARGPNIMKGYWDDKLATEGTIDSEGWLYTGDIGQITKKKNIKITDRKKNIFVNSGGKNIAPQPIENLLAQCRFIEQVMLIGDRREYCTALITPDFTQLVSLAEELGIEFSNESELISNDKVIRHMKKEIDYLQKDLAKFERVRKFAMLSKSFSIENGELSPKMSIRRHVVEKNYADFIDKMYR